MSVAGASLAARLHPMAGSFLFIGSGISRRYLKLPDWEGLLAHFADQTAHPFDYYRGAASNNLPLAASMIADEFYDVWWNDSRYAASRKLWSKSVTDRPSVLKIEVAEFVRSAGTGVRLGATERKELEALRRTVVEGIITTNYDSLLSKVFPTYERYVGQDELLLSSTFGIGETYMIHGSVDDPASLVLTAEDYQDFNTRNAYLAAKLMTVFVEHPVIFLGYSLSDSNIRSILGSLVAGLRGRSVDALKDKLIVVEWNAAAVPALTDTYLQIDTYDVPILRVTVPDFLELFELLGRRVRALPAQVLRALKEQVFEIVKAGDPSNRLYATSDIDANPKDPIDIVFGVGAKMTAVGIVGLRREEIIDDVISDPNRDIPPVEVLERVIAKIPIRVYMPVYKYLKAAGFLDANGLVDGQPPRKLIDRAARVDDKARPAFMAPGPRKSVDELEQDLGWDKFLNLGIEVLAQTEDHVGLREFLRRHRDKRGQGWWSTQYAKVAVAYDWLAFGPPAHGLARS